MQPLITRLQSDRDPFVLPSDGRLIEPAFRVTYHPNLSIDSRGWHDKACAYYAHAVARNPDALWLHVQRILLLMNLHDDGLFSAFRDLFQLLDGRGRALCQGLLNRAGSRLTRSQQGYLNRYLADTPAHRAGAETQPLIQRAASTGQTEDPLASAREQLAYGQLSLAQETLEQAVIENPEREPLHDALLEIFRHTRDSERMQRLQQRLQPLPAPIAKAWQALAESLLQESDRL